MPSDEMKIELLILTFFFIPAVLVGQSVKTVKKYSFKNFDSYVFTKEHSHQSSWDIKDKTGYLTPDSLDIRTTENEILKRELVDSIKSRKNGVKKFDRQYLGYLKTNGDRVLIISFINTNKGKKGRELKRSIDKDLIIGFGEWFEKNTFTLTYNLTTNRLNEY
jgi:hypothetical protein